MLCHVLQGIEEVLGEGDKGFHLLPLSHRWEGWQARVKGISGVFQVVSGVPHVIVGDGADAGLAYGL